MSKKETVEWLSMEVEDLRRRLAEARANSFRALERCDEQQRELKLHGNLSGPGYRYRMHCSDGRVWAQSAVDAREETIRWFAGNVLTRTSSTVEAVDLAFELWDLLEDHFADERTEHEAAQDEADGEPKGDDDA